MPTDKRNPGQQSAQSAPKGWQMEPIPSRPAYRDVDGNIRVPVWLTKNGRHMADTEMVLLPSEAALLADNLTNAMTDNSRSVLHELLRESAAALAPGVVLVSKAEQYQV